MTTSPIEEFQMDYAIHPGAILGEELEAREMSPAELARLAGLSVGAVSEIVDARRAITAEIALDLERVLEVSAQTWINLQGSYDLTVARLRRAKKSA